MTDDERAVPTAHALPMARPVDGTAEVLTVPVLRASPVQRMPTPLSRVRAIVELLALVPTMLVGGLGGYMIGIFLGFKDERWGFLLGALGTGLASLMTVALAVRLGGHRGATIGWTSRRWPAEAAVGLGALLLTYAVMFSVVMMLAWFYPTILTEETESMKAVQRTLPPVRLGPLVAVSAFVAVWEEIVFRGFVLTRLFSLVRRWWLTIPLGAVAFSLGHVYQGLVAMLLIGAMGLLMGILFVWRKSLVSCVVYHMALNTVSLEALRWWSPEWAGS